MKTRGLKDLYLPKSIAPHVKLLLFCALFAPIWGMIIKVELTWSFLFSTALVMIVDLELIRFVIRYFTDLQKKNGQKFEETHSIREVTIVYLLAYVLFLVIALLICTLVFILFLLLLNLYKGNGFPDLLALLNNMKGVIKVTSIGLLFSIPIFFFGKWQEVMKKEYKLREQNLIFQNETLKNQVNPHFLFNNLNTLSSLISNEVEIAGLFINRLSTIYRYILDNSSKLQVPLKEEIAFIKDYFYLHQIRNEGKIKLDIAVSTEEDAYQILPISLQLLVENAIKHNMATLTKPLAITIFIEDQNIIVKNNIQKMATQVISTKIGLKNLNERVKLTTGKEISVAELDGSFIVKVPLIL